MRLLAGVILGAALATITRLHGARLAGWILRVPGDTDHWSAR